MADHKISSEIDALPVGPELNALVAEYVMLWQHVDSYYGNPLAKGWDGFWDRDSQWVKWITIPDSDNEDIAKPWSPSTDIATAFEMEDEIKRRGLSDHYSLELMELIPQKPGGYSMSEKCFWFAHASPEIRCRAALRMILKIE